MANASTPKARSVQGELEKVLIYADGPQVVLLRTTGNAYVMGVAVDRVLEGYEFFGGRISRSLLEEYLRNRCDLRYVIAYPDRKKHYTFDLPKSIGLCTPLSTFEFSHSKHDDLLPEHRLFASDHTEEYSLDGAGFNYAQRYEIDGKWEVSEFAKFHRNLSDLYALSRSVESFEDENAPLNQRQKIMESFIQPWRGGGSYVTFFKEITQAGGRQNRPIVDAIQWASPGYMSILGDQGSFERIDAFISHYDKHKARIDKSADDLWKYLSERKLLTTGRRVFDRTSPTAILVNDHAKNFSRVLGFVQYRTLKKLSGNDPLVASKVLLAAGRRLRKMHQFFLEGRIHTDSVDVD